jgi:hypothetical protein
MLSRQESSNTKVFKRVSRSREEVVFEAQDHCLEASRERRKGKKGHVNSRDQTIGEKTRKEGGI